MHSSLLARLHLDRVIQPPPPTTNSPKHLPLCTHLLDSSGFEGDCFIALSWPCKTWWWRSKEEEGAGGTASQLHFFFFKLTALLGKAMCCFRLHMCVNGRGRSGLVVAALSEGWSDASFWREGASAAAYRLPVFTCAFRRLGNIFIISAPASAAQFSKELLNGKK